MWFQVAQDTYQGRIVLKHANDSSCCIKCREFHGYLRDSCTDKGLCCIDSEASSSVELVT